MRKASFRYTQEMQQYIEEIYKGKRYNEIAALFNARFNTQRTAKQMNSYLSKRNMSNGFGKRGYPGYIAPKNVLNRKYTEEERNFIFENYKGTSNQKLLEMIRERFPATEFNASRLKAFKARNNLDSGLTGRFVKGQASFNKGTKGLINVGGNKTSFKKGNIPHNTDPIGTEKITSDGYLWIKIDNQIGVKKNVNWIQKHRYVWEQHYGPVPEGKMITFLDGDRTNFDINNLEMIDNEINIELHKSKLRYKDSELTRAGINIAKINVKVRELEHERKKS